MIRLDIQAENLTHLTRELADRVGADFPSMLKNESRLFLVEAMRKMWPKNKEQGEKAVARDLNRLFTHVSDELISTIGSAFGISNIDRWFTFRSGEKKRIVWSKIDYSGEGMFAFHQQNRNRRGRINKGYKSTNDPEVWRGSYVVTDEQFAKYKERTENRVGLAKAGFIPALQAVAPNQSIPSWIKRHSVRAPGYVQAQLTGEKPFVLIVNSARGIKSMESVLSTTFRTRANALGRRLRRAQQGIIDDVTMGRRIRKMTEVTA